SGASGTAEVAGGSLVSDGSATIGENMFVEVGSGASMVSAGSLSLNDESDLEADCGTQSQETESGTTPATPGGVLTSTGTITVTAAKDFPATIGGCRGADLQGTVTVSSGLLQVQGNPLETDTVDTGTVLQAPTTIDSGATLS